MIKKPNCTICAGKCGLLWKDVRSWDINGQFDYYKCGHCGLVFLDPVPDEIYLSKYYKNLSYWGVDSKIHNRKYYIERAEKDYGYIYKLLEKFKKGKILDFGAGSGLFLYKLKIDGWEVLGTEVSANIRRFAGRKFGVDLIPPDSIKNKKFGNYFDLVILNNVIEHIPDPEKLMRALKDILKDDGQIIIITPNSESPGFKIFGRRWYHLDPGRHLYVFNAKSLGILLKNSGLNKVNILHGYYTHDFAGIYESIRHLTRSENIKLTTGKANNNGSVSKNIFKLLFKSASYIISAGVCNLEKYIGRGEVITVYAKKK